MRLLLLSLPLLTACPAPKDDAPMGECPTPSGTGTTHAYETISVDTTWAAADGPHLVDGWVYVREGATLTIEPCAEVRFTPESILSVGDGSGEESLVAVGSAESPIRLTADEAAPWGYVEVTWPATATLAHVTLEGAGSDYANANYAALMVRGDAMARTRPMLSVDEVTVRGAPGAGVWMREGAAFTEGSSGLVVEDCGGEDPAQPTSMYPVALNPAALASLPDGSYTENTDPRILIDTDDIGDGRTAILDDMAIHDRGVPYVVGGVEGATLRVGSTVGYEDLPPVSLTIDPNVRLEFYPYGGLVVNASTNPEEGNYDGVLRAVGSADAPIVFGSAQGSPAPGDWTGLFFGGGAHRDTRVEHAVIEHAGGDCLCGGFTCGGDAGDEAAVLILGGPPETAFLSDVTIRASAGHGVARGWTVQQGGDIDFTSGNAFEDVPLCEQTALRDEYATCDEMCG
jgi:hypothetical protein